MIKTRKVRRSDGRIEVQRVLTFDGLAESSLDDPLAYEKAVMWLEDIDKLTFVREAVIDNARSRRGPLHAEGIGRVVGYSKLTADAPNNEGCYTRRLFFLKSDDNASRDPATPPPLKVPRNAVNPQVVVPGAKTPRLRESDAAR